MDKLTYEEYFSLFWLARNEVIETAKILKGYKGNAEQWNFWMDRLKKYVNLAIKAKKLAISHIAD